MNTLTHKNAACANYNWAAPIYDLAAQCYSLGAIGRSKEASLKRLRPGSKILYVGCGTAKEAALAWEQGAEVSLLDQSHAMLARAKDEFAKSKSTAPPPLFIQADFFTWQNTEKYDAIVASYFLNVFSKPKVKLALIRMQNLLATNGLLFIADFAPPQNKTLAWLHQIYFALPLIVFWMLSKNAWHDIYDYEKLAANCSLKLIDKPIHKAGNIFPAFQSWTFVYSGKDS